MSEQYAFAIGFDRELEETNDRPDDDWMRVIEQVSATIIQANLPPIGSTRWDEFGQGYVFWGTEAECAAVRQALSPFDLYVEEDRNLDQGYYATADHTYYVDVEGQIYKLSDHAVHWDNPLEKIGSIPLDAYRSRNIDSDLEAQVQAQIQAQIQAQGQTQELVPDVSSETSQEVSLESTPFDPAQRSDFQAEPLETPSIDSLSGDSEVLDFVASGSRSLDSTVESAGSEGAEAEPAISEANPPATGVVDKTVNLATYVQQLRQLRQKTVQVSELEVRLRTALVQVEALESQIASQPQSEPQAQSQPQILDPQPAPQPQELERFQSELRRANEQNRLLQAQHESQSAHIAELEQALNVAQIKNEQNSAQIAELEQAATSAHEQFQIVQTQDEEKYARIGELEQTIASMQQASNARSSLPTVSPEDHARVQQKSTAQEAQILELQRQIQRLELRIQDLSCQPDQKVSLSKCEALEEEVQDKSSIITELRQILQQQERDLREWQTVAEAKVDWAEHQQLQEELRRLQSRKQRGFFARLFGWLWH